jgi:uncharacterized protein
MTREENRDLLESTHAFPGPYTWKVIGRTDNDFTERVLSEFRELLELEFDPPYSVRSTSAGRHVALTVEPWVDSAEDVLEIYTRLRETEGLVVLL